MQPLRRVVAVRYNGITRGWCYVGECGHNLTVLSTYQHDTVGEDARRRRYRCSQCPAKGEQ